MKHYPHHIGDFDRATRHLTRIERSVYRDLLDLYYDTEAQISLDIDAVCRRIIARSNEESTAVEQTLNEFFTKTPTGWYHERCEEEIAAYRANSSQRAQAGKASAEAKRLKKIQALNGNSTAVDEPLNPVATNGNGEPTNQSTNQPINHEPIEKPPRAPRKPSADADLPLTVSDLISEGAKEQHARDWLKVRAKHKAPLTKTSWDQHKGECVKAGITPGQGVQVCAAASWRGFDHTWNWRKFLPDSQVAPKPSKFGDCDAVEPA